MAGVFFFWRGRVTGRPGLGGVAGSRGLTGSGSTRLAPTGVWFAKNGEGGVGFFFVLDFLQTLVPLPQGGGNCLGVLSPGN
jgi:hypothetical protein